MSPPRVSVIVLAYGEEPLLPQCLASAAAATGVDVELIVVDNGYLGPGADALRKQADIWLSPGSNTGYTGGCNLGAEQATGDYLAFLNSDAVLDPDALRHLADSLAEQDVGIAAGLVLLLDEPSVVNSAGNPVHVSMISWAGGWGDPATQHQLPTEPASASGCLLMLPRPVFQKLGGFHRDLFAYGEDVDLSLRAWQLGYRVRLEPRAKVWHQYDFSRNAAKRYLLERNRWINLLTLYEGRTLLRLGPVLAVVEAGIWIASARDGWWREKARATRWLVAHRTQVRRRRRWVQQQRRVADAELLPLLADRLEPSPRSGEHVPAPVNTVLAALANLAGPRRSRSGSTAPAPVPATD